MPCPGSDSRELRLRVGLRGRRTLSALSHASMAGRTFEWWIEVLDSHHDISVHGAPLWVARELRGDVSSLGQRIIGRAPLDSGGYAGASSPELLWRAISRYCGPGAPRLTGVANTGLIHQSVQALLEAVEEQGDGLPSLLGFGSRSGGVAALKDRCLRDIGAAAGVAFVQAMESVCPGELHMAFAQLLKRRSFQPYLPENVRKARNVVRDTTSSGGQSFVCLSYFSNSLSGGCFISTTQSCAFPPCTFAVCVGPVCLLSLIHI
eukprot:2623688-Prymnesium_polylepis.1